MVYAAKTMSHAVDVEVVATHEVDGALQANDRIVASLSMPMTALKLLTFYHDVLILCAVSMSSKPISPGELPLAKPN